ncbi:hypothetical protein R9C00_28325 [Flammeovirgaceae bacterium SG7u.111]|nr:hypothetical protein [Flammeovirgaceae bacterium SG7u.132]WPO35608.1 hypothetical protein R9C00_28325 [Flammeovirgaceae bacterium SG7u.111]
MRWSYLFIVSVLVAGSIATCHGQSVVANEKYVEFEIDDKHGEDYKLIPMGELGVLTLLHSTKFQKNNKRELQATFLDTDLNQVWSRTFLIEGNLENIVWTLDGDNAYVLFEKDSYKYYVVKIETGTKSSSIFEYDKVKQFYISDFCVLDDMFFFGGEIKGNPAILRYDPQTDHSLVCGSVHQLNADLLSMTPAPDGESFTAILESKQRKEDFSVYVNSYDKEGKLVTNFSLPQSFDYSLLTYRPLILDKEETMIFGTYALNNDESAQGVYAIKLIKGNMDMLRFYDFGYLKNFFYFLEEKKMEKIQSKIQKRREKGKIYTLRYDMFVHDLKLIDGQVVFSADVFDPIMESSYANYGTLNGLPNTYSWRTAGDSYYKSTPYYGGTFRPAALTKEAINNKFVGNYGFELMNAFACGFDTNGNLLWDNSFSFEDVEVDYPIEMTNVYAEKDSLFMFTANEEELIYKISELKGFTDSITVDTLNHILASEKINEGFENGGIVDWYGNNFLASGIRYINHRKSNDLDRDVFFIYKISCKAIVRRVGE